MPSACPYASDPATVELLREKGLIQEQAPVPGRIDEVVAHRRAPRARSGDDVLPGPRDPPPAQRRATGTSDRNWRAHAEHVLATETDLPDYPDEMRETFQRLMEEHGIDAHKFLPDED